MKTRYHGTPEWMRPRALENQRLKDGLYRMGWNVVVPHYPAAMERRR